ncbi:MAG: alpha/beta hydrolase, partial [Fibrobacteria bacterium]|nr:alpha/beta hydrolase [Fibrobacteria bacterium]
MISFASPRLFALALLLLAGLAGAQTVPAGKSRLFLWAGRYTPIASPKPSNISDTTAYSPTDSVRNSWLLHYAAANPNGAAMIVIPGGGYANLTPWTSEGVPAANALTGYGVTVFILRYRVQPYAYPHAMWDVQRAVRWVRANAAAYGIDPNRVGVLGYSAGGHVASTAATHFDAGLTDSNAANGPHWYPGRKDSIDLYSSRPNFQALVYPMTTMVRYRPGTTNDEYAYGPGRTIYIGTNASAALVDYTSNEKQVTPQTPPAFINWGTGDALVDTLNSTAYRDSLISKGLVERAGLLRPDLHSGRKNANKNPRARLGRLGQGAGRARPPLGPSHRETFESHAFLPSPRLRDDLHEKPSPRLFVPRGARRRLLRADRAHAPLGRNRQRRRHHRGQRVPDAPRHKASRRQRHRLRRSR